MTRRSYSGNAVATTITGSITATSLTVGVADATGWPNTATGECVVTFGRGTASEEQALATRSGTTLTFASTAKRGVAGTTATSHASGSAIEHTFSELDADEANDHVNSTGTVHATSTVAPAALIIPSAAAPAETAEGSAVWDSDDDVLTVGTGAARKTMLDTNSVQTASNKTFTQPTIGDFTNANHTHASTVQGGLVPVAFHGVRVTHTADQATNGAGALNPMLFNTETYDTDAYHSTVSNTGLLTVPAGLAGYYLLHASIVVQDSSTAPDLSIFFHLATAFIDLPGIYTTLVDVAGGAVELSFSTIYYLAVGESVSIKIAITPGAVKSVYGTGAGFLPSFGMHLLGT